MSLAISGIGASLPIAPTPPTSPVTSTAAAGSSGGFADALSGVVDQLSAAQANADSLGTQVATGTLKNPHEYLLAANEASLATQMTVAVRNKALESFNEIMRMPL